MKNIKYVFIGGFLGAICRNILFHIPFLNGAGIFPINTISVNLLGCFFLSLAAHLAEKKVSLKAELHSALTTGFLGAFTTFSTFSKNSVDLIQKSGFFLFLIYVLISLIGGFLCVYAGYVLSLKFTDKKADIY